MTIDVTPVNDAPVAADIVASVLEGSTIQSGASRADLIGPTAHLYDPNYNGVGSYQIGYETVGPMDLAFSPDGNKLYVLAHKDMQGNIDKRVVTYDLQSPWDVSARTFNGAKVYDLPADPPSISNNAHPNNKLMTAGMAFGEAGTKMFVSQYNQLGGTLYSFDLSTAYDVSTASPDTSITIPDTSGENRYLEPFDGRFDLGFSEDGLSMFTLEQHKAQQGSGMLRQLAKYNLSTAWDISTADMNNRATHVFSTTDDTEVEAGFVFGGSGTKLFVIDVGNLDTNTGSAIREYNLATPYDISNMTEVRVTSLDGEWFAKHLYSIELSADETKIYLTGHGGGSTGAYIYEFDIYEDPALSNDTDAEGDALTLTFVASDAVASGTTYANGTDIDGQYGTLTIGANGSYRYVSDESAQDALDAGDKVTDSFAYTVSDGSATSTANLVVTVIGVNDTPTATNNTVTISEDATKTFAASDFNFADVDASSSLSSIKITSLPATGALTLSGSAVSQNQTIATSQIANLVYTPVANGNGDPYTTFQFKVNDGTADSASAYTMTIDVTPVNDAPTAADNTVTINEDATKTFAASDFNFADVDSDSLSSIKIISLPATGALTLSGSAVSQNQTIATSQIANLVYTPVANGNGDPYTTFQFKVNDGTADSASAYTMTIDVTPVNDAPTAADNTVTINEDATKTFAASDFNFADVDSDSLSSIKIISLPATGALTLSGSAVSQNQTIATSQIANLVYTPVANGNGDPYTTFQFKVNDGTADSASAYTMTIDVTPVNDAPTVQTGAGTSATNDDTSGVGEVTTNEDTDKVFAHTDFNFYDLDNPSSTLSSVTITALPTNGKIFIDNTELTSTNLASLGADISKADIDAGKVKFRPYANENGNDYATFTYTVSDGTSDSAVATMTVNVTPVNDAPVAANDAGNVLVGTQFTGNVLTVSMGGKDSDADGSADTLVVDRLTGGGTSKVIGSGNGATETLTLNYGTIVLGRDGSVTYNADQSPAAALNHGDAAVTEAFSYRISDGSGATTTATITFTITAPDPGNNAPIVSGWSCDRNH
jgi:VCBS repeat-containing protein